jgi:hypothetical protein
MKRAFFVALLLISLLSTLTDHGSARDLSQDELIYLDQMRVLGGILAETFQIAADLTTEQYMFDEVWRAEVASIWTVFELVRDATNELDVPTAFAGSHGEFMAAMDTLADNAPYCRIAFVMLVASGINDCTNIIEESTLHIRKSTELLDQEGSVFIGEGAAGIAPTASVQPTSVGPCNLDFTGRNLIRSLNQLLKSENKSPIAWAQLASRINEYEWPRSYAVLRNRVSMLAAAYEDNDQEEILRLRGLIAETLASDPCV